ncbi:hypothetical protein P3342_006246 [Pyrenophora teres f. teres]|nr:hypothetical protein P3342_006246 [Pyrenophora teres f. teres]
MSNIQQNVNNTLSIERMLYERVYPRAAPRIVAVGVSRFCEEMDAEMVDPLTAGGFDPLASHRRVKATGNVRRGQAAQPQRVREMMAMSPLCGPGKKDKKKRTCVPISAGAWMSSLFTRTHGKTIHQQVQAAQAQLPVPSVQPQAFVQAERVDSVVQRPRPAAVRHLHRSNAVRRPTELTREPKPVPCRLHRSNAVRRPTRQDSVVHGGGDEWELGHYPGGEADEYYLAEPVVQRSQLTLVANPVPLALHDQRGSQDGAGWEQQRLMSYSPLPTAATATASSPSDQDTCGNAVDGAHVDVSPSVPAAVPVSRRFSLDEVLPEVLSATTRLSLSDGVPETIASERRLSLDSNMTVSFSVHEDDDALSTVNGFGQGPSTGSSFTATTDIRMPVVRGSSLCSTEGPSPVIRGQSLCSTESASLMASVDQAQLTVDEPVDQSLFDGFSGVWIVEQDIPPPAYEDLAVNPFAPDCVDRMRAAQVVDARVSGSRVATGIFQPSPRRPGQQIGPLRPIYMPVARAIPEFMEDLRLEPIIDERYMEYRYESAERQARHLAWEAYVVPETQQVE